MSTILENKNYWNYFLIIEQNLKNISRYIEFSEANYKVFSIELASIIMSSSQEVDILLKEICNLLGKNDTKGIRNYYEIISKELNELVSEKVFIDRFNISIEPYEKWTQNPSTNAPTWWTANNKIKHDRTDFFERANLENAINSVGALLIANIYYYKLLENKETIKQVTRILEENNFIKLGDDNYYSNIIV